MVDGHSPATLRPVLLFARIAASEAHSICGIMDINRRYCQLYKQGFGKVDHPLTTVRSSRRLSMSLERRQLPAFVEARKKH